MGTMNAPTPSVMRTGKHLVLPGLASAHSHAFQRALRARTQRKTIEAGSFWSWRGLMYALVEQLDPQSIFDISRFAFIELALSGVTAVGEFHYVHHDKDGTPYANRTELAEAVIRAAQAAGVRMTLIRTAYFRGGYGQALTPAQRRFCDAGVDEVLKDVEALSQQFADDPTVNVALAAHSIRAVPGEPLVELAAYARGHGLPFHMHVAEQRREIEACLVEHNRRPVALLDELGVLDERFVAVHATHLNPDEIKALGKVGATVCVCRTTERDLGDGLPQIVELAQAGARLCVGADSHAGPDAFEEVRAVELDERSRTEARTVAAEAPALLQAATRNGYEAIGMRQVWGQDCVYLNANDPALAGADDELLDDVVVFGATPRAVDRVTVAGRAIVEAGRHAGYERALQGYEAVLRRLI